MIQSPLIAFTEKGMYVPDAGVYIDPWQPVEKALITHAHSDHARWGMNQYLTHHYTIPVLKRRLGDQVYQGIGYGEPLSINGIEFTFFPAGHVLGSAQIRVVRNGEIWVASGDYKTADDGLSTLFEPVRCNTFITESTFGLPIYNWRSPGDIITSVNEWWQKNAGENRCSVIFAYALGKAQRILQHVNRDIGNVFVHGAVLNMNEAYQEAGIRLAPYHAIEAGTAEVFRKALVIAPPSAAGSNWLKRFEPYVTASASGWMSLRGARRRMAVDKGFVMSDHADWGGLNDAIKATGAHEVIVTHGYTAVFAKWLREQGYDAKDVQTDFSGENQEAEGKGAEDKEVTE